MCILNVVGQHVRIGSKQRRQSLRLYLDDIAINATIRHWPVPHHPHFLSQLQKSYLHLRNGSFSSMYHCNMYLTNCTLIQIPLANHPLSNHAPIGLSMKADSPFSQQWQGTFSPFLQCHQRLNECLAGMVPFLQLLTHSAKILITDRRNRLAPDIIEACECYTNWRRSGLIDDSLMELND